MAAVRWRKHICLHHREATDVYEPRISHFQQPLLGVIRWRDRGRGGRCVGGDGGDDGLVYTCSAGALLGEARRGEDESEEESDSESEDDESDSESEDEDEGDESDSESDEE